MTADAPGRLLLTMPDCHVSCAGNRYHGVLALEYVAAAPAGRLALRVGAFQTLVPSTLPVVRQRTTGTYTIPGTPAAATLCVPLTAPNALARVVLDAFDVLLARFGVMLEANGDGGEGGQVLIDNTDGQGVGALSGSVVEDVPRPAKAAIAADRNPAAPTELRVRALLPEESAALLRSAHVISRGIVLGTTALASGMTLASSTFVARTTPNPAPVVFSADTRQSVMHAHALSGAAVAASAHTTELVLHVVDHTAAYVAPAPPPPASSVPQTGLAALAPSADLLLSTLAQSGTHLLAHGTRALADGLGHRFGADVGDALRLGSETASNVAAVCSDMRSVGQRALLVRIGQRVVAARMAVLFDAGAPPADTLSAAT